jgi:hypothetical protein
MNRRYLDCKRRCNRRTSRFTGWNPRHRRMNRWSIFLVASDELQRRRSEDRAPDDLTVWVWTPSVYPTLHLNQDRDAPRLELQHRMNRRWSSGSSDALEGANSKVLARSSSAPDDPTHRRSITSEQLCQRISTAKWRGRGIGWTDALKKIASVHPTLTFSEAVSQRLFGCLRLFIPPPLTHLRRLDCVEVQRSARHKEDHIQSIQVLNCSSLDLHMLFVCA